MASNLTTLVPSRADLLMAFPRLSSQIAGILGLSWDPFDAFYNDTNVSTVVTPAAVSASPFAQTVPLHHPTTAAATMSAADFLGIGLFNHFHGMLERLASFDGVFSYIASRWALSTLLLSIVLNRAHVYASSRERLRLSWKARIFLRLTPLVLLCYQSLRLLQALRCQMGFQLPQIRYKDSDKVINRAWVGSDESLYRMLSKLVFWEEVQDSCRAVKMIASEDGGPTSWQGSTALLWPLFLTLALSQFVETVSSALQGRQPRPETGVTMFEHSLAFAEAETISRTAAGLGLFGPPSSTTGSPASATDRVVPAQPKAAMTAFTFTRSMLLTRLNVPPEVLLISLISAGSHVANHTLGIFGLQSRFRLANTTIWGVLYLTLFVYSFSNFANSANMQELQKIRYPTVCIIGYLPHLLILTGILICATIYISAIICTLLSPPAHWGGQLSLRDKIKRAHENMSASVSLSNIRIRATEDFFTVLLKAGYQIMSAATEAVYFNEGIRVTLNPKTWLDQARSAGEPSHAREQANPIPLELQEGFAGGEGFGLNDEAPQNGPDGTALSSGYSVERKTMQKLNKTSTAALKEEGVGIAQRSGRWFVSWRLIEQILKLCSYCLARFTVTMMENLGVAQPPQWLLRHAGIHATPQAAYRAHSSTHALEFWMTSPAGERTLPRDRDVDVEVETRKRLERSGSGAASELDATLYEWWKNNGWWGDKDSSGEYRPDDEASEDDTTSLISESSAWDSTHSDESGAQTPTQESVGAYSSAVDADEAMSQLVRLLDPRTLADQKEARMLARRLRPDAMDSGTMTRSQYRQRELQDRSGGDRSRQLAGADEELALSSLISSRRRDGTAAASAGASLGWAEGGEGMGSGGPQCAICHSAPRTILVWPCRCLSLCEECRMSLAVNNFSNCVCCRRDVVAFSRLFVP